MRVSVQHSIGDLARDAAQVPVKFARGGARVVRKNAEQGNRAARGIARRSAGAHGKHYPNAFSAEPITPLMWEYGPDAEKPQGGMSFEFGSRNQPPHLDLAKSLDIQAPKFHKAADDLIDGLFW